MRRLAWLGLLLTWLAATPVHAQLVISGNPPLPAAQGGTGQATPTADNVLVGSGSAWTKATLPSCSNATTSKLLYDTTSDTFSCGTDQTGGGGGGPTVVTVSGDVTNSTTGFADATGLSFSVTAATNYRIECTVFYTVTAATVGARFSATAPASPTATIGQTFLPTSTTAVGGSQWSANDQGVVVASSAVATPSFNTGHVVAILRNGANAGTWQLRFAPETATAMVLKAGSFCAYATY